MIEPTEIPITRGYSMIVDADDAPILQTHRWQAKIGPSGLVYAIRNHRRGGVWQTLYAHRVIMKPDEGQFVDHINGNTLDNRRENLRICSRAANNHYARMRKDNKSGYKGVVWYEPTKRWKAQIGADGRRIGLGYFKDALDAARAYDEAASRLFGEFAITNKMLGLIN